jgi:hypothetical protein
MTVRPCLDCGINTAGSRCGPCERARQRRRNAARGDLYGAEHRRRSRAARAAQPWCSICGSRARLSWDHEHGQVECQSCNSSHRRNP